MLAKILITLSSVIGIALVWFVIKNVKLKLIVTKIKEIMADGKVTEAEIIALIKVLLG